ncbi:MAG: alcohol dehydrogenase catalytic domain-containing protein [Deltaproteobacteria bacterium]|nr:alcohol dehydrogenase catalytic domain-containing protein [Deltaproteobacteria bacterium]
MAGICNTDLEITKGYMGFKGVLGHEFVGLVEKINGPDQHLVGQRVVGEINCYCGTCDYCLKEMKTHCPNRFTLGIMNKDGAFAEYLTLPVSNLWPVPPQLPDEVAVFVEPLAAAFEILAQIHLSPTGRVLVLGDGKLGLLCAFVLDLAGLDVTVSGNHAEKLLLASEQGLITIHRPDLKPAKNYDVVIEATGSAAGVETAVQCLRPRGIIVLKSTMAAGKKMNLTPLVIDEITLLGSRCGPFGPALRTMAKGSLPLRRMITGIYRPEQCKEAFVKAGERGTLKILFDFR